MKEYILLFLLGGFTVSGIKYVSSVSKPEYAAVIGCLPIGLLTSILLKNTNVIDHYIQNYAVMSFIVLLSAICYHILMKNKIPLYMAYILTLTFWLILVGLKLKFINIID